MISTRILIALSALVIAQGQAEDNSCKAMGFEVKHNEYAHLDNCTQFNKCEFGKFHFDQTIGCTDNAECHPNELTCKCKAGYETASMNIYGYIKQCKPAPDSCSLESGKVIEHMAYALTNDCKVQKICYQGFLIEHKKILGCPAHSQCIMAEYTCKCDDGFLPAMVGNLLALCRSAPAKTTVATPTNPPTTAESSPVAPPNSCILEGGKIIEHKRFAHTDNCTVQKECYQGFLINAKKIGCPAHSQCIAAEYTCKCDDGFLPSSYGSWLALCQSPPAKTTVATPTNPPTTAGTGHQSSPVAPPNSCILEGGIIIEHKRLAHIDNCTVQKICYQGVLINPKKRGCPANSKCNAAEYTCKCDDGFLPTKYGDWLVSCDKPLSSITTVAAPTNPPTTAERSPVAPPNSCILEGGIIIEHKHDAHLHNCTLRKACYEGKLTFPSSVGCPANSHCVAAEYTCKCDDGFQPYYTHSKWLMICRLITTVPAPTTAAPTNSPPTTAAPTNPPPTTAAPTNPPPTTAAPTNPPPTTAAPTNPPPTTAAPTNPPPTTAAPTNPPDVKKSCPDMTWTRLDGNVCVKVFSYDKKTWGDARIACQGYGGDLVKIVDEKHTNVITGLLIKPFRYWIGIRDDDKTGTWLYSDKAALTSYRPWAYKEPNNRGGNEFCVEMISNGRGSWNDKRCSRRNRYVCQTNNQAVMSR